MIVVLSEIQTGHLPSKQAYRFRQLSRNLAGGAEKNHDLSQNDRFLAGIQSGHLRSKQAYRLRQLAR